jgi:hypothetical protein
VAVALAVAAAAEGDTDAVAKHLAVVSNSRTIDRSVVPLVRAMGTIIRSSLAASESGGTLRDDHLREEVVRANTDLEKVAREMSVGAPFAGNRVVALQWFLRGLILLEDFDAADGAVSEVLKASRGSEGTIELAFSYATTFHRERVVDALISLPETRDTPAAGLLRAIRLRRPTEETREDIAFLIHSLQSNSKWFPYALALGLSLPFSESDTPSWIELAGSNANTMSDPDSIVIGLARLLRGEALTQQSREKITEMLLVFPSRGKLTVGALAHISTILHLGDNADLWTIYGQQLDQRIESDEAPPDQDTRRIAITDILERQAFGLAERLIARWFPEEGSREAIVLRYELAWRRGNLEAAYVQLQRLAKQSFARPTDILRLAMIAGDLGRLHEVRQLLGSSTLPEPARSDDIRILDAALSMVRLTKRRELLLQRFADEPGGNTHALAATLDLLTKTRASIPLVTGAHTLVTLQEADSSQRELKLWITPRAGSSAATIERVVTNEPWIAPVLDRRLGEVIEITEGIHAGRWLVARIESGTIALHMQQMAWAERAGIEGGGVKVLSAESDPVEAIRKQLTSMRVARDEEQPDIPILAAAHLGNTAAPMLCARYKHLRLSHADPTEMSGDRETAKSSARGFVIDPLSAYVIGSYGLTTVIARAAGNLWMPPQSCLLLHDWRRQERDRLRGGTMSTGFDDEGRMYVQSHDGPTRGARAAFWRGLATRARGEISILHDGFQDDAGRLMAPVESLLGQSGAALLAWQFRKKCRFFP